MSKLLIILAIVLVGCGQQYKTVEEALAALKTSRELALSDRTELFKHFDMVEQLINLELPKRVRIPKSTVCSDYVLTMDELSQVECRDALFNTCPRGLQNYEAMAQKLVQLCESIKENK